MGQHNRSSRSESLAWTSAVAVYAVALGAVATAARAGDVVSAGPGGDGDAAAFRRVHLRCGADHMAVAVDAAPGFEGVVYTRGSYHERRPPCFLSARHAKQQQHGRLTLRFPLDACHTKKEADSYSNVVVVQADEELVMPGDAAFALHCDFSRPRDVTVGADLSAATSHRGGAVASRISLVEADPAAEHMGGRRRRRDAPTALNASDEVEMDVEDALAAARTSGPGDDFEDYDEDHEEQPSSLPRKDEL